MKNIFLFLLSAICYLFFAFSAFALSFPKPAGYVSDFAGLYSSGFKSNLETDLSAFEKTTGVEIAVVTIKTLDGSDIDSYAVKLFEDWKIGKKGKDNGLLLLIAKEDRKIRIEVGYGLEPYITDGRSGEIIRNLMSPEFKKENYEGGTMFALTQLKKYISDKDIAPVESAGKSNSSDGWGELLGLGIVVVYIIATYVASFLGRTKEIWPGGAIGAVLGGIGGLFMATVLGLFMGAVIFGALGLLLDYILSKNYQVRKSRGLPTGFFHTWGGFSGGGSGGSFGGFGGGSSGGGGGSGGW